MLRTLTVILCSLIFVSPAMARPRHYRPVYVAPRPTVVVRVNPWTSYYRPDPRPGWHWVDGHFSRRGAWIPGYWAPDVVQPGYVWVAGHWAGTMYVDGYWREPTRAGWVWVEGDYDDAGNWVPGYWMPEGAERSMEQPPQEEPPPPEIHHEYE